MLFFAISFALNKFRKFVQGRSFIVRTDHLPLKGIFSKGLHAIENVRIREEVADLVGEFNFQIEYRPGKDNVFPDYLSRRIIQTSASSSSTIQNSVIRIFSRVVFQCRFWWTTSSPQMKRFFVLFIVVVAAIVLTGINLNATADEPVRVHIEKSDEKKSQDSHNVATVETVGTKPASADVQIFQTPDPGQNNPNPKMTSPKNSTVVKNEGEQAVTKVSVNPITPSVPLENFKYIIIIDAGSTGSRLHLIKYSEMEYSDILVRKTQPGLSFYVNSPEDVYPPLKKLLESTLEYIPVSIQHETELYVFATAGLRQLAEREVSAVMDVIVRNIRKDFIFKFSDLHFQVIEGVYEALYGWISLNYLKSSTKASCRFPSKTYSMIEMGGGSIQMAIEASSVTTTLVSTPGNRACFVKLPNCAETNVVVASFSEYGSVTARSRFTKKLIFSNSTRDPCLLQGQQVNVPGTSILSGNGDLSECLNLIDHFNLLNKSSECQKKDFPSPCQLNGVSLPEVNVSSLTTLIGLREFHFVPESLHKSYRTDQFSSDFTGEWNMNELFTLAHTYCDSDWASIQHELITTNILSQ